MSQSVAAYISDTQKVLAEAAAELRAMPSRRDGGDVEANHSRADDILCACLRALCADDVADAFEAVEKWYA